MKKITKQLEKITAITIIAVFLGVGVTQALTLPTSQNVIIQYGTSEEVNLAVQKLVEHNTNSKTITSTNAMLISTLQRSFGSVFIVGHGSEEGIQEASQIHSWKNVSKLVSFSPGQAVFFVACNSNEAPKYVPNKFSYGFSGSIEAVSAALIASYLAGSSSVTFEAIVTRLVQVFANPSKFSFLPPTIDSMLGNSGSYPTTTVTTTVTTAEADSEDMASGLSSTELASSLVNIFLAILLVVFASLRVFGANSALVKEFFAFAHMKVVLTTFSVLMIDIGLVLLGRVAGSIDTIVLGGVGLILGLLFSFALFFIGRFAWYTQIWLLGSVTAENALGGWAKAILIVACVLSLVFAFTQLLYDANDNNDHVW